MNNLTIFIISLLIFSITSFVIITIIYLRKRYLFHNRVLPTSVVILINAKKIYESEPYKYFSQQVFNDFATGTLSDKLKESLMIHRIKQGRPFRMSLKYYNLTDSKFNEIKDFIIFLDNIENIPSEIFDIVKKGEISQEYI